MRELFALLRKSMGSGALPIEVALARSKSTIGRSPFHAPSSMDMPSDPTEESFSVSSKPFNLTGDFSGDEKRPSTSSIPCSSRRPSFNEIPVRLGRWITLVQSLVVVILQLTFAGLTFPLFPH